MSENQAADGLLQNYSKVTDNRYDVEDYKNEDETSQGLAETHEQFHDSYFAGAVDANLQYTELLHENQENGGAQE